MKNNLHKPAFILIFIFHLLLQTISYAESRKRIAILDFSAENVEKTYANAVRNIFEVSFYKSKEFEILERNEINSILNEQGIESSGCKDKSCAVKIGKLLSADMVVMGSLNKLKGFTIAIKFVDVRSGSVIFADSETAGNDDQIKAAVADLANRSTFGLKNNIRQREIEKPYNITANINYFLPAGDFAELVSPGYGGTIIFSKSIMGIDFGLKTGYWYFPGKTEKTDYMSMIPLAINLSQRFWLLNLVFVTPSLSGGVSYNRVSYDSDGIIPREGPDYETESKIEPLVNIAIDAGLFQADNFIINFGVIYGALFESGGRIQFFGLNLGVFKAF